MARSRAKLVQVEAPDNDGAELGAEVESELFEEPEAPQVVTTVSVPRSSPPTHDLPLYPGLPAATARAAAGLRVTRVTPASAAGYCGQVAPTSSEEDLRRMFGGRVFQLELVNGLGQVMARTKTTKEIDADPKRPDDDGRAARPAVDVETVVRRVVDPLREEMERVKAAAKLELEAERERRRLDTEEREAKAKREQAEADAKHKRELEALDARARADAERERQRFELEMKREEQRAQAALAQQREMISMVIKSSENNTQVLVATLQAQKNESSGIGQLAEMAELVNALKGSGEDPTVQAMGKLSEGLSSFAKLAGADRGRPALRAGPGVVTRPPPSPAPVATSRPVAPNPAPAASAPAAGEPALPPPSAATVPEDLKVIAADWMTQGADPAEIVRGLREGRYVVVPADELEEIDEPDPAPEPSPAAAATAPNGAPSA